MICSRFQDIRLSAPGSGVRKRKGGKLLPPVLVCFLRSSPDAK